MLYFSEIEGKKIETEDKIEIGFLEDLVFLASAQPKVTKLVIRSLNKEKIILPFQYVVKINSSIVIKKLYNMAVLVENELFLKKNLLDKQIIDIVGNKIVRVNDVSLQEKISINHYEWYLTGVDVGLFGILRTLKIESFFINCMRFFGIHIAPNLLPWGLIQPLELSRGHVKLNKKEEKLQNLRPEDLADYLEKTNETNVRKFLKILDKNYAAEVVSNLNINYQRSLFQHWEPDKSASVLEMIHPEEAVDILLAISKKRREEILHLVEQQTQEELQLLISLSRTSIGNKLTTEFLTVPSNFTVNDVISSIKKNTADFGFFAAIYVINEKKQLIGVFNLHELLMHNLDTPVYKFMIQNIIEIRLTTPIEIAVRKMLHYRLPAIPVVNNDKQILGIVTFDQVVDYISQKM
ncbi:hypothetical protein COY90_02690 [Candidatus Roizmanbacteria bacterium CG_4_10_14_0_8_um_filter_39_9]|uniref:CBS domain-containing protein n=1 Tax=Candidatus Roizmanbacteria bacterium CG_4_10_14_0_8_um_filter_39_9 TaxID=1974829 RepID=A0A2M7QCV6_9BACT|nr:MAG: hypothetical protein COY90_02690 [Candidatus Roizmanbacteria bacterium CG_4_10_14_0_8_um_filter_39_9]